MDFRRPQPPFPLAEDDGKGDGRICEFPWSETEDIPLPEGYIPTKFDVINGRGRKSYNHIANRRFRELIGMNLKRYQAATCKVDKTLVVVGIVTSIRRAKPCGGFIKKNNKTGLWVSISDEGAREKVGHCLRDMLAAKREEHKSKVIGGGFLASSADKSKSGANNSNNNNSMVSVDDERGGASRLHQFAAGGGAALMMHQRAAAAADHRFPPEAAMSGMNPALWGMPSMSDMYRHAQPMNVLSGIPSMGELAAMAAGGYHPSAAALMHHRQQQQQQQQERMAQTSFNDIDAVSLQKGNLAEMSDQQRSILLKLEGGFKGTVEELIAAVGS